MRSRRNKYISSYFFIQPSKLDLNEIVKDKGNQNIMCFHLGKI